MTYKKIEDITKKNTMYLLFWMYAKFHRSRKETEKERQKDREFVILSITNTQAAKSYEYHKC